MRTLYRHNRNHNARNHQAQRRQPNKQDLQSRRHEPAQARAGRRSQERRKQQREEGQAYRQAIKDKDCVKRVSEREDAVLEVLREVEVGECNAGFGFVERGLDGSGGIEGGEGSEVGAQCYVRLYFGAGEGGVGNGAGDIRPFAVVEDVGVIEVGDADVFGNAGKEFGGFAFNVMGEGIVVEEVCDWVGT